MQKHLSGKLTSFLIEYGNPVGYKNLVHISTLNKNMRSKIERVQRGRHAGEDSVFVNVLKGAKMQSLNTIEVGILDNPQLPFYFVTAYPGDMMVTEDFPSLSQSKDQFRRSEDFWKEHVFLE